MNTIFEINNLTLEYQKNKPIVKDINITINEGEFISIIGPNGCGKTTLIKSLSKILDYPKSFKEKLMCYSLRTNFIRKLLSHKKIEEFEKQLNQKEEIKKTNGKIFFKGKDLYSYNSKEYAKMVSYVPQIVDFPNEITVYDFVKMGRYPYSNITNFSNKENKEAVDKALELVNLKDFKDKYLGELSGGQRQRALIALSLAQDTKIIILDEPTNHLDIRYQLEIIHLLHDLNHNHNKTIILVIHDINHAMKFSDKIIVMNNGEICYYDEVNKIVNKKIIKEIFGVNAEIIESEKRKIIADYWIDDLKKLKEYHEKETK